MSGAVPLFASATTMSEEDVPGRVVVPDGGGVVGVVVTGAEAVQEA